MENQNPQPPAPQSETPVTLKLSYAPSRATFVPLKLEERLLGCTKYEATGPDRCEWQLAS